MAKLKVVSPFSLEGIDEIDLNDESDLESYLSESTQCFKKESIPLHRRIEILQNLLNRLKPQKNEIALLAAKEGGKPLKDSIVEFERGLNGIQLAIESCQSLSGEEISMGLNASSVGRRAFTIRKAIGPVASISAFNHPFNLAIHQIIPAVITGCPVLFKPDLRTPLSGQKLINELYESGLPEVWCRQMNLENNLAEKLARDFRIQYLNFIGSARVGWKLRSLVAPGTRLTLEHGGIAPIVIDKDYDLSAIVPEVIKAAFYHAGQVCVSTQKVFVHRSQLEELIDQLSQSMSHLQVGDPEKEETDIGPMIAPQELDRMDDWIAEAVDKGAKLLVGGQRLSETCYSPSLILNVSPSSRLATEEVFGPVLSIYSYEQVEEAVNEINRLPFSFQSSIFTDSLNNAWSAIEKIQAGTVLVNDHTAFRVDWMPFAGKKRSGLGTGGIKYTMKDMTEEKLLIFKSPEIRL